MSRAYFPEDKIPTASGTYAYPVVNPAGSNIATSNAGLVAVAVLTNDYAVNNVTNAAYFQLTASTPAPISLLEVMDTSGEEFILAFGAAGLEVDQANLFPGGNDELSLIVPIGTRISIKAKNAALVNLGNLTINCLG